MYINKLDRTLVLDWDDRRSIVDMLHRAAQCIRDFVLTVEGIEVELGVEGRNYIRVYVGEWLNT